MSIVTIDALHRDRLKTLAKFLLDLKVTKRKYGFNLRGWGYTFGAHGCNTVACAGGYATQIPELKAAGLHAYGRAALGNSFTPKFEGKAGFGALEKFFGIPREWTEYLFSGTSYPYEQYTDPKAVAHRINGLLAVARGWP